MNMQKYAFLITIIGISCGTIQSSESWSGWLADTKRKINEFGGTYPTFGTIEGITDLLFKGDHFMDIEHLLPILGERVTHLKWLTESTDNTQELRELLAINDEDTISLIKFLYQLIIKDGLTKTVRGYEWEYKNRFVHKAYFEMKDPSRPAPLLAKEYGLKTRNTIVNNVNNIYQACMQSTLAAGNMGAAFSDAYIQDHEQNIAMWKQFVFQHDIYGNVPGRLRPTEKQLIREIAQTDASAGKAFADGNNARYLTERRTLFQELTDAPFSFDLRIRGFSNAFIQPYETVLKNNLKWVAYDSHQEGPLLNINIKQGSLILSTDELRRKNALLHLDQNIIAIAYAYAIVQYDALAYQFWRYMRAKTKLNQYLLKKIETLNKPTHDAGSSAQHAIIH